MSSLVEAKYQGSNDVISARIQHIRQRIIEACTSVDRDPTSVTLIGVSKYHLADEVCVALDAGCSHLGENHVQEIVQKAAELAKKGYDPHWHFIGTLQRNKVKHIVGLAEYIHSVDRMSLLETIIDRAKAKSICQNILLQVNYSGVPNKHGFEPNALLELLSSLNEQTLSNIRICGLMTMAEPQWTTDELNEFFRGVHTLYEQCRSRIDLEQHPFDMLSMGMSQDFECAIQNGATHIRIGREIFGPRSHK